MRAILFLPAVVALLAGCGAFERLRDISKDDGDSPDRRTRDDADDDDRDEDEPRDDSDIEPEEPPEEITIPVAQVIFHSTTIHPAAPDGFNWDGVGSATNDTLDMLGDALVQQLPYANVVAILNDVFADPDAFGLVGLTIDGEYEPSLEYELASATLKSIP